MDVQTVTTSLDALLLWIVLKNCLWRRITAVNEVTNRATSTESDIPDPLATEAFCVVLKKEQEGPYIASRLIVSKMHSENPNVALLALQVLEVAMKKGGSSFQAEIGKFKFLNEMVKLVSPKYLGNKTSQPVKEKVLLLMHTWQFDYPKEIKIKEAYLMLQKQGVIKNDFPALLNDNQEQGSKHEIEPAKIQQKKKVINVQDEEKSKLLKKLLQSKNPEDIQAANRLIKNMVREDERRMELIKQQKSEISSINNNVSLLNELLDQYKSGSSSDEDLQLIKDIYSNCKDFQRKIYRITQEAQDQEDILCEVLQASDELLQVLEKYKKVIEDNVSAPICLDTSSASLLDLDATHNGDSLILSNADNRQDFTSNSSQSSELLDIFLSIEHETASSSEDVLKPLTLQDVAKEQTNGDNKKISAMDELNLLGENLLKSSLVDGTRAPSFTRAPTKVPMNSLFTLRDDTTNTSSKSEELDLNVLIGDCLKSVPTSEAKAVQVNNTSSVVDDLMIDMSDGKVKCEK